MNVQILSGHRIVIINPPASTYFQRQTSKQASKSVWLAQRTATRAERWDNRLTHLSASTAHRLCLLAEHKAKVRAIPHETRSRPELFSQRWPPPRTYRNLVRVPESAARQTRAGLITIISERSKLTRRALTAVYIGYCHKTPANQTSRVTSFSRVVTETFMTSSQTTSQSLRTEQNTRTNPTLTGTETNVALYQTTT